ncbi:hypothetical protein [Aestuariicoccus sp. MJ-SS9]|uniref:hypothetical protein n=1 Tax=Aestuariicoccus sp. MJ-SS9 TaxID=3079855 RepID=UPI002913637E|nr:hypothetical protein [Aestuariicoccus sp. MJ-SS9]MDU8913793.1 hypothetical protein [Aestuariicoccus sp. MJ-SS9]
MGLAYREAETTRAFTTTRAMRVNAVPVGLSYGRGNGAFWWGLSLHGDAKGDFQSASAALRWEDGPWRVAIAAEAVRQTGRPVRWNTKLGARWRRGRMAVGLTAFGPRASGNADALALDVT